MSESWESNSKFILEKIDNIDDKLTQICAGNRKNSIEIARLEEKLNSNTKIIGGVSTVMAGIVAFFTAWITRL